MLGNISSYRATKKSEGKQSIHSFIHSFVIMERKILWYHRPTSTGVTLHHLRYFMTTYITRKSSNDTFSGDVDSTKSNLSGTVFIRFNLPQCCRAFSFGSDYKCFRSPFNISKYRLIWFWRWVRKAKKKNHAKCNAHLEWIMLSMLM